MLVPSNKLIKAYKVSASKVRRNRLGTESKKLTDLTAHALSWQPGNQYLSTGQRVDSNFCWVRELGRENRLLLCKAPISLFYPTIRGICKYLFVKILTKSRSKKRPMVLKKALSKEWGSC